MCDYLFLQFQIGLLHRCSTFLSAIVFFSNILWLKSGTDLAYDMSEYLSPTCWRVSVSVWYIKGYYDEGCFAVRYFLLDSPPPLCNESTKQHTWLNILLPHNVPRFQNSLPSNNKIIYMYLYFLIKVSLYCIYSI